LETRKPKKKKFAFCIYILPSCKILADKKRLVWNGLEQWGIIRVLMGDYIILYKQFIIPWKPINMTQLWMNHN
jgi:hypothetical protein